MALEFNKDKKYHTMMRAFERLKRIYTNNGNIISNADASDAAEDFFNQCYHFKDWLKKDSTVRLTHDLESYISTHPNLSLAADYCNSFKHAGLDRNTRSGKNIDKINTHIKIAFRPTGVIATSRLELTIDNKKYDALQLADECIREWNDFLRLNNIVIANP